MAFASDTNRARGQGSYCAIQYCVYTNVACLSELRADWLTAYKRARAVICTCARTRMHARRNAH